MKAPPVSTFKGIPIEQCSREHLLEAVQYLAAQVWEQNRPEARRARILGQIEMMKRGEPLSRDHPEKP